MASVNIHCTGGGLAAAVRVIAPESGDDGGEELVVLDLLGDGVKVALFVTDDQLDELADVIELHLMRRRVGA